MLKYTSVTKAIGLSLIFTQSLICAAQTHGQNDSLDTNRITQPEIGSKVLQRTQPQKVRSNPFKIVKTKSDDDNKPLGESTYQGSQSINDVNAAMDQMSNNDQAETPSYECVKYKTVPKTYSQYGINGKWLPHHNTSKWHHVKRTGPDYFQHNKRRNSKVDTVCKKHGNTRPSYVVDANSDKGDACRMYSNSCPAGYTDVQGQCSKELESFKPEKDANYAPEGRYVANVAGVWLPHNDPRNFKLVIRPGRDVFQHKRNKRRKIRTWCKFTATYTVDEFPNGKDACVNAPGTGIQYCPSGYSRRNL